MLYNRFAAPFVFLVTGIPEAFQDYLVETAVFEVDSTLKVLFVERGVPVPHDYVMTLTNYNMRTDSEYLRDVAENSVRHSVQDLLFNVPSDTSGRIRAWIRANRDNVRSDLSDDEAWVLIRGSVRVESLEVIVPTTRTMTTVYNVYLYPPTANPDRLGRWRSWIANQSFYAGNHGMGVRYQHPFRCNHCKTIDHPSGLCPHMRTGREREGAGGENPRPDDDDEFLPMKRDPGPPGPKPKPPTPGPSRGKAVDKGKGKAPGPQGKQKAKSGSVRNRTAPGVDAKKRRLE